MYHICVFTVMATVKKIGCFVFLAIMQMNGVRASTCEIQEFDESRQERENYFINVSYLLNVMDESFYSGKIDVIFEVCRENQMKPYCTFTWKKQSNKVTIVSWSPENETTCFAKHRSLSSSVFTFEILITLLVRRAYSLMKFSITDRESKETFKTLRLSRLEVLYLPEVTSLAVDGHEVRGDYLIDKGQRVTVVCSFDKGNPPAPSRMLDKKGKELGRTIDDAKLRYSFSVMCEDDWPVIQCEGLGSDYNRRVSFLVKCPPKYIENVTKFISSSGLDAVTLHVRAHTAIVENVCLLAPMSSEDADVKEVNCTLHGTPPDLVLRFHLNTNFAISQGRWMLILRNEEGSAKTILSVSKHSISDSRGCVPTETLEECLQRTKIVNQIIMKLVLSSRLLFQSLQHTFSRNGNDV